MLPVSVSAWCPGCESEITLDELGDHRCPTCGFVFVVHRRGVPLEVLEEDPDRRPYIWDLEE